MLKIAVTGLICSGKSTVSALMEREGIPSASADEYVHILQRPGGEIYNKIQELWGERYITSEGFLNRKLLVPNIFDNQEFRENIERISHPPVLKMVKEFLRKQDNPDNWAALVEIPLLFEAGWEEHFDVSILTRAPEEVLIKRISDRNKIDAPEAKRWLDLRRGRNTNTGGADFTIDTACPLAETEKQVKEIIKVIRRSIDEDR